MTEALTLAGATLSPPVVVERARETSVKIPEATASASCCVIVVVVGGAVELSEEPGDRVRTPTDRSARVRRTTCFMISASDALNGRGAEGRRSKALAGYGTSLFVTIDATREAAR